MSIEQLLSGWAPEATFIVVLVALGIIITLGRRDPR